MKDSPLLEPRLRVILATKSNGLVPVENLEALSREIAVKNSSAGIGGLLVYGDGAFLQLLEGPRAVVSAVTLTIGHTAPKDTILLVAREVEAGEIQYVEWREKPFVVGGDIRLGGSAGSRLEPNQELFQPHRFTARAAELWLRLLKG